MFEAQKKLIMDLFLLKIRKKHIQPIQPNIFLRGGSNKLWCFPPTKTTKMDRLKGGGPKGVRCVSLCLKRALRIET